MPDEPAPQEGGKQLAPLVHDGNRDAHIASLLGRIAGLERSAMLGSRRVSRRVADLEARVASLEAHLDLP